MKANTLAVLHMLAQGTTILCASDTPKLNAAIAELWDKGLVNICPPGDRYKLNDAGRAFAAETFKERAAA